MNLFALIGRKLTEFKYRYYGLNIIQELPSGQFNEIIEVYKERGWELADPYQSINPNAEQWKIKLRKGTSTVYCEWNKKVGGSMLGPQRILYGMGNEFGLSVSDKPK